MTARRRSSSLLALVLVVSCRGGHEPGGGGTGIEATGFVSSTESNDSGTTMLGSSQTGSTTGTGPEQTSTGGPSSTAEESSTGVWVDPDCPDVHEGDLLVEPSVDVDELRRVGRIKGHLLVDGFDGEDLEFLSCLYVVEGSVVIGNNPNLTSLAGLDNLGHIGKSLDVHDNPSLSSMSGMGPVAELVGLYVRGNAALQSLELPSLEVVDGMTIGLCSTDTFDPIVDNPGLETLDGLSGLVSVTDIRIGSQSSLASISRLIDITMAGGFQGGEILIDHNPVLPIEEVELLINLANTESGAYHCANLDESVTNECKCPNPA